eukprot:11661541-Alexandrium_andersonii.AAC.1
MARQFHVLVLSLAGTAARHVAEVARSLARPAGSCELVCASGAADAAGVYPRAFLRAALRAPCGRIGCA